ncbi:MAG: universal stress protein [Bacteroidota bacterium]
MEKILVTTDLSVNSRPGIRFAMQLAKQRKAELIVLHVYYVLKATSWSAQTYKNYIEHTKQNLEKDMASFMKAVKRESNIPDVNFSTQLKHGIDTVESIMAFAATHGCSYICISTRGAGVIKQLFGTNTSELIRRSGIPVIAIPKTWRLKPIKNVLYAADFKGYSRELRKVVAFAGPINAQVEMLHLIRTDEEAPKIKLADEFKNNVNVSYRSIDIESTILENIDKVIKLEKPSVLVLFTHQHRTLIDRILFPGNAEEYCFDGKVPLLSFNKAE